MNMRQSLSLLLGFALLFADWSPLRARADVLKILNPTPEFDDRFGDSLTVVGDNILIGVANDDTIETAFTQYDGGPLATAGAAYLMDGATGDLLQTFFSPETDPGGFGRTVAAAVDNNILVYGLDKNSGASEWGKLFHINATTGDLLQTYESPDPNYFGKFGKSAAAQGSHLLIGSQLSNVAGPVWAGAAYLLDATTGGVLQTFLPPTPTRTHKFGSEVALAGDNVVIGTVKSTGTPEANEVHVFSASTGALLHTLQTPGSADFRPRLASDGNNILVGDSGFGGSTGAAYLYDAPTGNLLRTFQNPTPETGDRFGTSVAIQGNKVLVGANADDTLGLNSGAAYLFDAGTGDLLNTFLRTEPGDIGSFPGFAFSQVGFLGDRIVIGDLFDNTGAERAGAVYVFPEDYPTTASTGDTNGDGIVNIDDLNNVRNNFGTRGPDDGTLEGDALPFDGLVNIDDLNAVRNNFGAGTAPVPEPSSVILALLGTLAIALNRRQSCATGKDGRRPRAAGILESFFV